MNSCFSCCWWGLGSSLGWWMCLFRLLLCYPCLVLLLKTDPPLLLTQIYLLSDFGKPIPALRTWTYFSQDHTKEKRKSSQLKTPYLIQLFCGWFLGQVCMCSQWNAHQTDKVSLLCYWKIPSQSEEAHACSAKRFGACTFLHLTNTEAANWIAIAFTKVLKVWFS